MIETIPFASTLAERLVERILREGPITFCDWMRAALYDEREGYYCRPNEKRWGREGDYRTSPERSHLFAATFARYFACLYDKLDQPFEWTIVETGAGDGRFAHGLLKTLQSFFPRVFSATHYIIDEIGSGACASARERLGPFADRLEFRNLDDVDVNPGIVFSNELLDAFPVHRVTMKGGRLLEFYVGVGSGSNFSWTLGFPPERVIKYFEEGQIQLVEGQVAEVNLEIENWLRSVSAKINKGFLVTVDYGSNAHDLYASTVRMQGTLRGFQRHRMVDDVLTDPGEQDLTSTVNWTFVQDIGEKLGLKTVEFQRQDKFLLSAGLLRQLDLESQQTEDQAEKLRLSTAAREMVLPDGMAGSFQVLVQQKLSR